MTINSRGRSTMAGSPAMKAEYETNKLGTKPIISVDFASGKVTGPGLDDFYRRTSQVEIIKGEDSMRQPVIIEKDVFLKALSENKSVKKTAEDLGISIGTFYRCKEKYAAEIETMRTLVEAAADGNQDAKGILKASGIDPEPVSEVKNIFEEILNSVDAGSVIHKPTTAEVEEFFTEPEPVKSIENRVSVSEAIVMVDELQMEADCVDQIVNLLGSEGINPPRTIASWLINHQANCLEKIERIKKALDTIMVTI